MKNKSKEEKQIDLAINRSHKEAGHNAYFGNGFKAGIEYQKNLIIDVDKRNHDLERFWNTRETGSRSIIKAKPRTSEDRIKAIKDFAIKQADKVLESENESELSKLYANHGSKNYIHIDVVRPDKDKKSNTINKIANTLGRLVNTNVLAKDS